ncbi:MAG: BamA/TamA family outer membrane protein, partial [Bacteroidales bacterium]|nr:BamA/TamA family outer membrane protein [Bacteroidales bacterium]
IFSSCNTTRLVPEEEHLLQKNQLKIIGKSDIKTDDLEPYLQQHPNTKTAVIFPFHVTVYNLSHSGEKTKIKKLLGIYKIGEIIGEEPVIFSEKKTNKTVKEIKTFLNNKGYFNAAVDYTIIPHGKKTKVNYQIYLNRPYNFSKVSYHIEDRLMRKIIVTDSLNSLIQSGKQYDVDLLDKERDRIVMRLRNNGYYYFNKDFVSFMADSSNYQIKLELFVGVRDKKNAELFNKVRQRYRINKIYYYMDFNPKQVLNNLVGYYQNFDTVSYRENIYFLFHKDWFISPKVLQKGNYQLPDSLYDFSLVASTYDYLWKLATYRLINIRFEEDTTHKQFLNCFVELTPMKKYTISTELEGTNTSGNLGVSASLNAVDRSLLYGAEIFNVNMHGGIQRQTVFKTAETDESIIEYLPFNTIEAGLDLGLKIPKFWLPFNAEKFIRKHHPHTVLKASGNYQKRPEYENQIIVGSFGYQWKAGKHILNIFNPLEVNSVYVRNIDEAFSEKINGTYLQNSFSNHMITATNYTFLYNTQNVNKIENAYFLRMKLESSGNVLYNIEKNADAPQTDGYYTLFNLPYSNYLKADLDFRFYNELNKKNSLVYRLFGGMAVPYGNLNIIPFEKRYYGGGANGIRAWQIRSLGPGSYYDSTMNYPNQSGDMQLEANAEYRFHMFWMLNGAFFVDAGNIWSVSKDDDRDGSKFYINEFYKQIALGAGAGLRFDFTVFVFRLDLGLKLRDPKEPEGLRWIPGNRKFIGTDFTLNLGIGYPF